MDDHGNEIIDEMREILEQKDSNYRKPSLNQELFGLSNVGPKYSGVIKKLKDKQAKVFQMGHMD